jgi:hypothetical protein
VEEQSPSGPAIQPSARVDVRLAVVDAAQVLARLAVAQSTSRGTLADSAEALLSSRRLLSSSARLIAQQRARPDSLRGG